MGISADLGGLTMHRGRLLEDLRFILPQRFRDHGVPALTKRANHIVGAETSVGPSPEAVAVIGALSDQKWFRASTRGNVAAG